jgi:hypothetical protein
VDDGHVWDGPLALQSVPTVRFLPMTAQNPSGGSGYAGALLFRPSGLIVANRPSPALLTSPVTGSQKLGPESSSPGVPTPLSWPE